MCPIRNVEGAVLAYCRFVPEELGSVTVEYPAPEHFSLGADLYYPDQTAVDNRLLITRCPLQAIRALERGHPDGEGWNTVAFMGEIPSDRQLDEISATGGILTEEHFYQLALSDADDVCGKVVKLLAGTLQSIRIFS